MDRLLKGLKLEQKNGKLVKPFEFSADTRKQLTKWLSTPQIDYLEKEVEFAKSIHDEKENEPTLSDSKRVLSRIQELAHCLSVALEDAPQSASLVLDLVSHKQLGDYRQRESLGIRLRLLSIGLKEKISKFPKQKNRVPRCVFMVSQIAAVLEPIGIKASISETSRFFEITHIVLTDADILGDDHTRSIKEFISTRKSI